MEVDLNNGRWPTMRVCGRARKDGRCARLQYNGAARLRAVFATRMSRWADILTRAYGHRGSSDPPGWLPYARASAMRSATRFPDISIPPKIGPIRGPPMAAQTLIPVSQSPG